MCTFMVTHVLVHANKSMRVHVFVYSFVSLVICVRDVKVGSPAKTCLSNILSICESSSRLEADIKAVVRREAVVSFGAGLKQLQHA